jgi:predicted amidohydrolase
MRLAVAQTYVPEDPADVGALRESGAQIRSLMRQARADGATLAQFPEGAVVYPGKRVMSSAGPATVADADWSRANWDVIRAEAGAIAGLAAELSLWVAFGSPHSLTPPRRPHNSLYVVSPGGVVVTRYDKRFLSNTEVSWMYTPGTDPVVFEVGGLRFGCALCIEAHFPEVFAEYERLGTDCVLLSVMVDDPVRPVIAQAHAALYSYWVGYSAPAQFSRSAPAGVVAPSGHWIARCPADGRPGLAVADLDPGADADTDIAVRLARPWRRKARAGLYDRLRAPADPRSGDRTSF